jgi:hypothetical protein
MNAKRILLALFTFAAMRPLVGCRHRCCGERSYAPPPCNNCGPSVPPGFVPPPPQ